ncbi:hypothetical protein HanRHA438_Chr02g0057991 [Helianthus annuus]|nr:hypothetical protein HanRHA438_Chr02g0057991 [Helianthus annuus]
MHKVSGGIPTTKRRRHGGTGWFRRLTTRIYFPCILVLLVLARVADNGGDRRSSTTYNCRNLTAVIVVAIVRVFGSTRFLRGFVPDFRFGFGSSCQVKSDRTTHGSTLVSRVNSGFGLSPRQTQSTRTTFVQLQSTKFNVQTAGQQQSTPVKARPGAFRGLRDGLNAALEALVMNGSRVEQETKERRTFRSSP